ncbi:MAG: hypothetical protein AB7J13_01200 [Pyrinomonadaceae bacterium]
MGPSRSHTDTKREPTSPPTRLPQTADHHPTPPAARRTQPRPVYPLRALCDLSELCVKPIFSRKDAKPARQRTNPKKLRIFDNQTGRKAAALGNESKIRPFAQPANA